MWEDDQWDREMRGEREELEDEKKKRTSGGGGGGRGGRCCSQGGGTRRLDGHQLSRQPRDDNEALRHPYSSPPHRRPCSHMFTHVHTRSARPCCPRHGARSTPHPFSTSIATLLSTHATTPPPPPRALHAAGQTYTYSIQAIRDKAPGPDNGPLMETGNGGMIIQHVGADVQPGSANLLDTNSVTSKVASAITAHEVGGGGEGGQHQEG
eukprot:358506-Chlamydomonas_euryale.AAC.1